MVAMNKGCLINAQTETISVKKDALQLDFNQKTTCKNGFVCAIDLDMQMMNTLAKCVDDYEKSMDIMMTKTLLKV